MIATQLNTKRKKQKRQISSGRQWKSTCRMLVVGVTREWSRSELRSRTRGWCAKNITHIHKHTQQWSKREWKRERKRKCERKREQNTHDAFCITQHTLNTTLHLCNFSFFFPPHPQVSSTSIRILRATRCRGERQRIAGAQNPAKEVFHDWGFHISR